ncbi:MAG: GHKL domain-containing protein [Lachnospiraceae bacterium]|nr:GHKL domain-containing protein [Lachnospiraceae bacterium]
MTIFYGGMEYIAIYMQLIICSIFCGIFLAKEKISERKNMMLLSMLGAFIVYLFNNYVIRFSYLHILMITIMMVSIQWMIYKRSLMKLMVFTWMYEIITATLDFFSVYVFSLAMHIEPAYLLNNQSIVQVVVFFVSKMVLFIIAVIICKTTKGRNNTFSRKYIGFMGVCFSSIFTFIWIMLRGELSSNEMKSILFLIILVMEFLLIVLGFKVSENYKQQQQIALVKLENQMLKKTLDDTEHTFQLWKASIHDYKNHIITLSQLSRDGKIEEIRDYLKQQNALLDQNMFYIKTGNFAVDAIINTKRVMAEQQNIAFHVNVVVSEECKINDFDIVNILGNLIDNALEACSKENNSYIDITMKEEKKFLIIRITNSFTGELPKNIQTTKKDKIWHGMGIKSIRNIVEKYNGKYEMVHKNSEVIVHVMLLNKEN